MDEFELLKSKSPEELEEWFSSGLSLPEIPVELMLNVLEQEAGRGNTGHLDGWAELLIDALIERSAKEDARRVLAVRAGRHEGDEGFRSICVETALRIFNDRQGKAFVESCGFDGKVPVKECMRRLETLTRLRPGVLCYDRSWGLGVICRVDDFYKKVTIDFKGKSGHQMLFGYLGEALEIIGDDHVLAINHREPDRIAGLSRDDPAALVKMVLRDFGDMSAPELQEFLVKYGLLAEDGWKTFWDKARKSLKSDPLIEVPSKRSEAIRLLHSEKSYNREWFAALKSECDVDKIIGLIEDLGRETDIKGTSEDGVEILRNRLAFALKADDGVNYGRLARTAMLIERLGVDGFSDELAGIASKTFDLKYFMMAADGMQARELDDFIKFLAVRDDARAADLLMSGLFEMGSSLLGEAIDYLCAAGRKADVVRLFAAGFEVRDLPPAVLYWLARNMEVVKESSGLSCYDLLFQMTIVLDLQFTGEQLRTCNQLRALLENAQWVEAVLADLTDLQRADILSRVRIAKGWDTSSKRSVMAKMIKLYPELEGVVADRHVEAVPVKARKRMTSQRSYRERQEQLKRLVNEEIPANSKEIGVARSYGDLRENAEYEAARQHQSILMRRKDEMERDLAQVSSTDFAGLSSEFAGMGVCVVVRRADGALAEYNILGEWDNDDRLGIISSRSKLAEALDGKRSGDQVELPAVGGGIDIGAVVETRALSEEVRKWIKG